MTGTIETVSPRTVCLRVFFGAMIILWSLILSGDQAESTRVVAFIVGGFLFYSGWTAVREPKAAIRYALKPSGVVLNLIREWNPPSYRLEIEHEKSLHSFLKERLPFVKVTRQYGSARVKWDIAVGKDVMVELKVGFKTTQKLQRLIGQIDLFQRELDRPLAWISTEKNSPKRGGGFAAPRR